MRDTEQTNTETGYQAGRATLPAALVLHIERLVGGDVVIEDQVLRFIAAKYGARSLLYLPHKVAVEIIRRPADFLRAAKQWCEPELRF